MEIKNAKKYYHESIRINKINNSDNQTLAKIWRKCMIHAFLVGM